MDSPDCAKALIYSNSRRSRTAPQAGQENLGIVNVQGPYYPLFDSSNYVSKQSSDCIKIDHCRQ